MKDKETQSPKILMVDTPSDSIKIIDTTYYSEGFPEYNMEKIIPRTQYLSQIEGSFGFQNSIIFVNGEDDAGKTTLLSQFCKKHSEKTISVFFNPLNNLDFQLDFFCTNIVQQINFLMKIEQPDTSKFIGTLQYREALYQFKKFYKRKQAKINIVIDGLESKVKEDSSFVNKLFAILPFGTEIFNFIITGAEKDFILAYPKLPKDSSSITILGFSDAELIAYLDIEDPNEINTPELYQVTKGYPGRLRTLKRLLKSDEYSLNDIKKSTSYLTWVELDCDSIDLTSSSNNLIFSILSLSERTFSLSDLEVISNLEYEVLKLIIESSSVLHGKDKNITFISQAHKRYFANILRSKKENIDDLLISFYTKTDSLSSLIDLPRLYANKKEWEEIIDLVDDDYFYKILERSGSLKLVTQTLELGVKASENANRNFDLLRYSIQGSILNELDNYHFWESEIEARISICDYAGAISLAESAAVLIDRLNLLALIARRQKEVTNNVDEVLINLIQELYTIIDLSDAGEKIYDIVAHLMYAIPNLAIEMIEKSSGNVEQKNINDWVIAKLSIAAIDASLNEEGKGDNVKRMDIVQNLNSPSVKKINRAITFLVGNYSSTKVLDEVQKISDPYEKLRLLRLWLHNNKSYVDGVEDVISVALDELISSSSDTSVNIQVLAELSSLLPQIKDKLACEKLYHRFKHIENDLSDLGLTKDIYTYKLNIFHSEYYFDRERSKQTINKLLGEIDVINDALIRLESFSESFRILSILSTASEQFFLNKIKFVYQRVLSLSADLYTATALQSKISENFLQTIGSVNPRLALKTILEINSIERREQARSLIVASYLDNNLKHVNIDTLNEIGNSFELKSSREEFYLSVLERYSSAKSLHYKIIFQLVQYQSDILNLSHIGDRIKGLTYLYKIASKNEEWKEKLTPKLESQLYQTWKSLDADWEKIDFGFQICYDISKEKFEFAKKLFDDTEGIKKSTWGDSKLVSFTFLNSIKLIIRAYNGLLISSTDTKEDFNILNALISKVPSNLARLKTWTEIGFFALDSQRDDIFKKVLNDHVILIIHDLISEKINIGPSLDAITLIYLFDSGVGNTYLSKLDDEMRADSLNRICYYHVTKRNPFEPYDGSPLGLQSNFFDLIKALKVLVKLNDDHEVYHLLNLICESIRTNKDISSAQASTLVTELRTIASKKFPDLKNIKHDGYKILAELSIDKISKRVSLDLKYWDTILMKTNNIPNLSDKIFVKAMLLDEFPFEKLPNNQKIKVNIFEDISISLNYLPVHYEFVQRVIDLSDIMYRFDKTKWKKIVEKAFTLSSNLNDGVDVYATQRKIIDSMYRLDPSYSKELIKIADKENQQNKINKLLVKHYDSLEIADKIKKGKSLEQKEKENTRMVVKSIFSALIGLNSNKILPKKLNELVGYLSLGNKLPLHEVYPVFMYYLNNCARTYGTVTDNNTVNIHRNNFNECVDAANLIQRVSQKRKMIDKSLIKNFIDEDFSTNTSFKPKSREAAFAFIKSWISDQVEDFIIIADGEFIKQDLEIFKMLKECSKHVRIDVLGSRYSDLDLEKEYKEYWSSISEGNAPFANITFCYLNDNSDLPFEGRWIITKNSGLKMSTNISLLGNKKSGEMSVLKSNEALRICEDKLIEYVNRRKHELNGQRIYYKGFSF